jgi:peptidoglycan/LPS O-acetylase OafA/YrhL
MRNVVIKYDNLLVLRGAACFVVVLNHLLGFAPIDLYVPFGFHSVWLFFFISSYLLTKGFITGRFSTLKAFYISRATRLLPVFYFVQIIVVIFVLCSIAPSENFPIKNPIVRLLREGSILILAPWTPYIHASDSWNSVVWSLVIEIHFILLIPFFVHSKIKMLMLIIMAWMCMLLVFEYNNVEIWNANYEAHYYNLGFFVAGMIAARMEEGGICIVLKKWLATIILGLSILIIDLRAHIDLQQTLRLAPIFFVPMLLIVFPTFCSKFHKTNTRPPPPKKYIDLLPSINPISILEKVGAISYTLFLTHKFIGITLIHYFGFIVGFLGVFFFASMVYIEVETRFRYIHLRTI